MKTFKREFLGKWVEPKCAVQDNKGNHCPDRPVNFFKYKGKEIGLCKRCYIAFEKGTFNRAKRYYGIGIY